MLSARKSSMTNISKSIREKHSTPTSKELLSHVIEVSYFSVSSLIYFCYVAMDDFLHLNKIHHKEFHFRALKEYLFTAQSCWGFPKHSWLIRSFDEKLGIMAQNGLIDHLVGKHKDPKYLYIKEVKRGPRKLNISQLLGGFEVLVGGLFISLIVFLFEVVARRFKCFERVIDVFM
jgi:hypothetical protein